jgi:hypothetical protein
MLDMLHPIPFLHMGRDNRFNWFCRHSRQFS